MSNVSGEPSECMNVDVDSQIKSSKSISETDKAEDEKVKEMIDLFSVNDATLREVVNLMERDMEVGLGMDASRSSLKMLPSFVRSTPKGTEIGQFLALDVGGSNFRVLLVKFDGAGKSDVKSKIYEIPEELMTGNGDKLFDHIASCLRQFTVEMSIADQQLPLGFTFCFPLKQEGLAYGKLIHWTKGFNCSGVVGKNVVRLLEEACDRRKDLKVNVLAVLNDTVGTLMTSAYTDTKSFMGVIVGAGTNACYLEKLSKCPKLAKLERTNNDEVRRKSVKSLPFLYSNRSMIINVEWGGFGDKGSLYKLINKFDKLVDAQSINPGKRIFEKLISGLYVGQLARLVIRDLAEKSVIFSGKNTDHLLGHNAFTAKDFIDVEIDATEARPSYSRTMRLFNKIYIYDIEKKDCEIVHKVCQAISLRSANLCAAGLAALLNRMQRPQVTIGIDGAMYCAHPNFKTYLEQKLANLMSKELQFKLKLAEDGSGRGAALVAAVAKRLREEEDGSSSEQK